MTTWNQLATAMPYDETMWPGYYYTDGPPPFNRGKRAHRPAAWPHGRPCWCGAKRHRQDVPPSAGRPSRLRFWR